MTEIDYAARVSAGAELLDREHPGWHDKIDLSMLNLAADVSCIIGQLYGSYGRVYQFFNTSWTMQGLNDKAALHGFVWATIDEFPQTGDYYPQSQRVYSLLTELWTKEIETRRELKAMTDEYIRAAATANITRIQTFLGEQAARQAAEEWFRSRDTFAALGT